MHRKRKYLLNEQGSVLLEMIPSFLIFFAVISFTINFFIYAYSNTILSLAAQEAGRGTVTSFSTSIGETEGQRFISHYGVGSLIKSPNVTVSIKKNQSIKSSVVEATASGDISYTYLGSRFFEHDGLSSKTVTYYLEYTLRNL